MAATAETVLKIDTKYDGRGFRQANRDVRQFEARNRGLESALRRTANAQNRLGQSTVKWKKHFDSMDKAIKMMGTIGLKGLSLSLKGVVLELGLMSAAMLAVHASFVAGNWIMKAMRSTMGPLAAGMAAFTAGIAAAAAAIREQEAAMWAYKTTSKGEFGSSLNQTRQVMRALHTDSYLASAGIGNLNKAFAAVSKNSTFTQSSQNLLKGLMDFASAGQPLEEGVQKAGELIAILQDTKKSFSEAKVAAEGLFPDKEKMKEAFKKLGIDTKAELEKAIRSGSLSKAAGVEGQFEAVSGTLMNRIKGYFNILRNQLADLGQPLLEPMKHAAYEIFNILRRGFVRISASTQRFGMGSMLDSIVSATDKIVSYLTDFINNNLHKSEGIFQRMSDWWKNFRYGWDRMLDILRPYIDGARVIEKMFGQIWKHVKAVGSSRFGQFNEWLQDNSDTVMEFGDRVGLLIGKIMEFQGEMSKLFQRMLPFINDVVKGIADMVGYMTSFIKGLGSLGGSGAFGAFAAFALMRTGLSKAKNTKGGFMASPATMNVQAQNVNITGPGAVRPGAAPTSVVPGGRNLGTTQAILNGGAVYGGGGGGMPSRGMASRGMAQQTFPTYTLPGMSLPAGPSSPIVPGYTGAPTWYTGDPRYRVKFGGTGRMNRLAQGLYNMASGGVYDPTPTGKNFNPNSRRYQWGSALRQARTGGKFNYYRNKANQSMTGKMGASLGLSALSMMAPQEAQGALALGSMVGTVNPLAGLAVGLGGTALKAQTTTGGLLSGAAGGAALGAFFGPQGALIGGLVGGVTGAIMGSLNKKKQEVKRAKAVSMKITEGIVNDALSGVFAAVQKESGIGRSATRDIYRDMSRTRGSVNDLIGGVPGTRGNYAGFLPDFMDRGATGGQMGLAIEHYTGKRMPKIARKLLGSATTGMDIGGNLLYGAVKMLGGKSLLDNRVLNPFGYGTNNYKDVDRQKQEEAVQKLFAAQKQLGIEMSSKDLEDALKKPGEFIEKTVKDMELNDKAMGPIQEKYNKRLDELGKITGKTDQEIVQMAKSMGVNLMDSTKSFGEIIKELGLSIMKTSEQFRTAMTNIVVDGLSVFDEELKRLDAPEILNETARAYRDLADSQGGKVSKKDKTKFLRDIIEQNIALFGDPGVALAQTIKSFQKGGTAYDKGGAFYGMKDQKFYDNPAFKEYINTVMPQISATTGQQLTAKALQGGMTFDQKQLDAAMKKMTPEQLAKLITAAEGGFNQGSMRFGEYMTSIGLGGLKFSAVETKGTEQTDLANLPAEIAVKTTELIDKLGAFYTNKENRPEWFTKAAFDEITKGDTSTPRGSSIGDTTSSKLAQTLGRHASMDGMLTGKRTITSAYRNYGLGSINSDHVTGRAYDLVGQNLGQYQSLVKAGGGFAEFHGVGGARHLHVVPGPGIGDTPAPMGAMTSRQPLTMGGGGGNNYNFYITGGNNASPNEIADMVVAKVKDIERQNRDRS